MEYLKQIKDLGELTYKPYSKLKLLELNKKYKILKFEKIKDKFGFTIVAELEEYKVHLPNRFVDFFNEKKLKEFNKLENFHMIVKEFKKIKDTEDCAIITFE